MGLARELWAATAFCTKLTWCTGKFILKNAPAALGLVWEAKRELTKEIEKSVIEGQKKYKAFQIEQEIRALSRSEQMNKHPILYKIQEDMKDFAKDQREAEDELKKNS